MSKNLTGYVSEFTPATVNDRLFSIPLYQRLYSWETEQVEQLLDDLLDTYNKSKGDPENYYIGNLVKAPVDKITHRNPLIDGQQRMTVFWLMGFVFKKHYEDWNKFILIDHSLRLDFTARDDDRKFFNRLQQLDYKSKVFSAIGEEMNVNPVMMNTINVIVLFVENRIDNKEEFAKFVYEHAKMIEVTLPDSTDLNKYFEIMNNRGIQLEKHEILKARILEKISSEKQINYAHVWDACSQMNRFIEDSFEKSEEKNMNIQQEITALIGNKFSTIEAFISKISTSENKNEKKLYELLENAKSDEHQCPGQVVKGITEENFTSVINFPSFLLHTYKILKNDKNGSLKDKDLLKNIIINNEADAISFIHELFTFRILFDQYIIKNFRNGITNLWETRILQIDENEARRKKAFERSSQILSMLNVSTSIEHWLPPVLKYLKSDQIIEDNTFCSWLEKLDNCFAYARIASPGNIMMVSNEILSLQNINDIRPKGQIIVDLTRLSKGTGTERYWFYKLDYCLWKKWTADTVDTTRKWRTEIYGYQFRSNRSIEHIYPQKPEDERYWDDNDLDSFGNLALISISSNSEYSRHGFKWKQGQFEDRIAKKWGVESLKLVDVYERVEWNPEDCKKHQDEMIVILNDYHKLI